MLQTSPQKLKKYNANSAWPSQSHDSQWKTKALKRKNSQNFSTRIEKAQGTRWNNELLAWSGIIISRAYAFDDELYDFFSKDLISFLNLHKCRETTRVWLGLSGTTHVTDSSVISFVSSICRYLKHLQELWINITYLKITDKCLERFANEISKNLIHLQKLKLRFEGCDEITDKGLSLLGKDVGKNVLGLKSFQFILQQCPKISDNSIQILISNMKKRFKELRFLVFSLTGCENITDKTVQDLANFFDENKSHIETLEIYFSECGSASNQSLSILVKNINKYLPNLKTLKLEFQGCEEINDTGFELLAAELTHGFTNLRSLVLNFNGCDRISDHGLKALEGPIQYLKKLSTFKLSVSGYNRITLRGLERLVDEIGENMKDLKHLSLDFSGNFKMSQEFLQKINQKVGYIYDFTIFN